MQISEGHPRRQAAGNTATKARSRNSTTSGPSDFKSVPSSSMTKGHADSFCIHKASECMNQIMKIVCKILLFVIKEGYTPGNKSSDKDRIFLAWTFFSIIQCNVRNLLCEPLCQTLMQGKCEHTIPRVTKHRRYKSYQLAHEAHGRNLSARPLFHRTVEKQEATVKTWDRDGEGDVNGAYVSPYLSFVCHWTKSWPFLE